MAEESVEEIKRKIDQLNTEHRDLDEVLQRLAGDHNVDDLQIRRLKKRKLYIKDTITRLESQILPDITA